MLALCGGVGTDFRLAVLFCARLLRGLRPADGGQRAPQTSENMDASLSARVLQRRILLFSALLVLFGGLVASFTSMMPLVHRIVELRHATFEALLENRQLLVEEFLQRAKDVARSVNSRTRARQLLGEIDRGEDGSAGAELKKILQDAHGSIPEIGGIIWLDNRRQVAAAVGLALPSTEWIIPDDIAAIAGPLLRLEGHVYVLIAAPIRASDSTRLGTSLLLFNADDLESVTSSYTGLGQTGEVILGSVSDGTAFHFFPMRNTRAQLFSQQFPEDSPIHAAMKAASTGRSGSGTSSLWNGADYFYRYVPVHDSGWGFVLVMEEDEMFSRLHQRLYLTAGLLIILLLLTASVMVLVLRPLTGRLLLRGDELAGEVARKTIALQNELEERRRAEIALRERSTELARSNEDLSRFAYVTSHDLQEPLRMVISYLILIERRMGEKLDSDSKEFFAFAVDGARRMQTMITALLSYSRVTSKDLSSVPFRSEEALADALLNLQLAVEESAAQVTHGPLPVIRGDAPQITHLFQNLISNAIKFRRPGEAPKVEISAIPAAEAGWWQFTVRDNGIGIDPQYFGRLFTIFQRLHTREQYEGSGIGLALCRRIVERHAGRIWVESSPGEWTAFHFTLPGAPENAEP